MDLKEELGRVMRQYVDKNIVAGVNLLVEKDGQEICYCQAGLADRENGKEITRDTIFRLYSQTKPVTAAAAMILMERGKLELCQPVSDFLPSFREQKVCCGSTLVKLEQAGRSMMVQDLLRMTSGLVYPDEATLAGRQTGKVFAQVCSRLGGNEEMTTREVADSLAGCTLSFLPGQEWQYSASADVLGAVIEVASGMKYAAFLKKEILEPLGMEDTAFWVPQEKQHRLTKVYESIRTQDGQRKLVRYTGSHLGIRNDMSREPAFASGGAGLASTLDDYMKFARMLQNGGSLNGVRILRPATVRYMTGGQLLDCQQKYFEKWDVLSGYSYGNLMRVCKNPGQCGYLAEKGEYGWDGWLGTHFANFPGEKLTILVGTQMKDSGTFALTYKLRNLVLSSL